MYYIIYKKIIIKIIIIEETLILYNIYISLEKKNFDYYIHKKKKQT